MLNSPYSIWSSMMQYVPWDLNQLQMLTRQSSQSPVTSPALHVVLGCLSSSSAPWWREEKLPVLTYATLVLGHRAALPRAVNSIVTIVKLHVCSCSRPLPSGACLWHKPELEARVRGQYPSQLCSQEPCSLTPLPLSHTCMNHVFLPFGYIISCGVLHFLVHTLPLRPHPLCSDRLGFGWRTELKSPSWVCFLPQQWKNAFNLKMFLIFLPEVKAQRDF